jgi:hypothetical protein
MKLFLCYSRNTAKFLRVDRLLKLEFDAINRLRGGETRCLDAFQSSSLGGEGEGEGEGEGGGKVPGKEGARSDAEAVVGVRLLHVFILDQLGRDSLAAAVYQHACWQDT